MNTLSGFEESGFNRVFWSTLAVYLGLSGIPTEQIGQAMMIVVALAAPMFGCPVFAQLKARRPETTIPAVVGPCLKVVPAECYIDLLKTPKLESKILDRTLDGKAVVSTSGTGLPPKDTKFVHQSFLRKELKVGYVGALQENDPLQEDSSVLVLNLEEDTSSIATRFGGHTSKIQNLPVDAQAILLQAHLRLLHSYNPTFNIEFLERRL